MKKFVVITTINKKTKAIEKLSKFKEWTIVLVGDKKSQPIKNKKNIIFLSLEEQEKLGYEFVSSCPLNHYTRKNIGYIFAIKNGADLIIDTDDDNIPYSHWGKLPSFESKKTIKSKSQHINIYSYFSKEKIWPRGFPLDEISSKDSFKVLNKKNKVGVWQGLADLDPDVDAIYRMIFNKKIKFLKKDPVALDEHLYSPSNSQNTVWTKEAFLFMYLPTTVSSRFTDILRGYVIQRLLWQEGLKLGFLSATVFQERNKHNLMKDFSDEIDCYTKIKDVVNILESVKLGSDKGENLKIIYRELAKNKIVSAQELNGIEKFIKDISK